MKTLKQKINTQSGFVILFSMMISTIILIMSAGIFQIAQKETVLSSYSRESQYAFYAADAGVECALYWDISTLITQTKFPTSQPSETLTESFTCGVDEDGDPRSITAYKYNAGTVDYDNVFGFRYADLSNDSGCAFVFVEKETPTAQPDPLLPPNPTETRVTAVGYNVCDGAIPDLDDPTLLERRLSVRYSSL